MTVSQITMHSRVGSENHLDEGFLDIITALLAESAPPQVISTSYGFDTEADLSLSLTE